MSLRTCTIFCLLFFICLGSALAQDKRLEGKITNTQDVEGIHVLNLNSHYNSITNAIGEFYITVKPLDTLVFSSISYQIKEIVIDQETFDRGFLPVTLEPMVNELDEVYLGPSLSGDISRDIQRIEVEDPINFDDLGIPGFKGKPQERKVPLAMAMIPTRVDIEALYKHISGYYRKLKIQREWEFQNQVIAHMMQYYGTDFFEEVYEVPEDRVYDFLLFCMDTSDVEQWYQDQRLSLVMQTFEQKAAVYVPRIGEFER